MREHLIVHFRSNDHLNGVKASKFSEEVLAHQSGVEGGSARTDHQVVDPDDVVLAVYQSS